jgi:hypothetical protein
MKGAEGKVTHKEPGRAFHNNSILPCHWEGFTLADYRRIKEGLKEEVS